MEELGKITAKSIIEDFQDQRKVTHWYLSAKKGQLSFYECTDEEKLALVKKSAINYSAESSLLLFTEILNNYEIIDMFAVDGNSNIKVNGYMSQSLTPKELKRNRCLL